MATRDTGAEQLIKDTAKRIFFAEGKMTATTQDIADAAGVTRTLVNYYFRSKDILFKQVFDEAMMDMKHRFDEVLSSTLPFNKKLESFIDLFYTEVTTYPYKETFMISEINSHDFDINKKDKSASLQSFVKEIQQEMDHGNIKKMKPVNFLLNLFSLMSYPLITQPIFKHLFDMSDQQYQRVLKDRKKMILEMLLN
jgi:TetR/AcrR family transcriptional regulator